jgi:hypothetical protein
MVDPIMVSLLYNLWDLPLHRCRHLRGDKTLRTYGRLADEQIKPPWFKASDLVSDILKSATLQANVQIEYCPVETRLYKQMTRDMLFLLIVVCPVVSWQKLRIRMRIFSNPTDLYSCRPLFAGVEYTSEYSVYHPETYYIVYQWVQICLQGSGRISAKLRLLRCQEKAPQLSLSESLSLLR